MQTTVQRTHCYWQTVPYFPQPIRQALERVPEQTAQTVHEIRLRTGQAVSIGSYGRERYLTSSGTLSSAAADGIPVTPALLTTCLQTICEDSVHSYARELAAGFVTIAGGCRVGICASAVLRSGIIETIRHVSGLNFRIARQVPGCAAELYNRIFAGGVQSLLLLGEPGSGKTTILRDLCRLLGERFRVSVIDERGELGAVSHGIPQNQLGRMTDLFDGYPKAAGMQIAVRVMTPQLLVCDEIGSPADTAAVIQSAHAGVRIIASAHAGSIAQAYRRPQLERLLSQGIFDWVACLGSGDTPGQIQTCRQVIQNA